MALFVNLPNEAAPRMSDENSKDEPWRKRKMIQGRWRDPDDQADVVQRVEKTISVKLLEAERDEFDAQIAKLGLKRNRAMRIAARRIGGFLELDPETIGLLRAVTRSISGIAVNVNQIAKAANRTHDPDYQRFLRERAELGKEIARLDAALQPLLDVAQRRSDGLQRLKDASE
ncbi:DNA mobilization endonuclease VirD1/MobC family subunit [Phaeobacter inhibens]|uniref:DNA mobilization endonuclease VirD1/MobC family subunit n=1 Tax=Phaeobacter inhibens TaxID=221822 RepID=UPI0021A3D709|nr:DNA mobilization endonuclease VirD1/MobC family subunit [Phaeobacter inhibens]